ncbi:MAG: 16S rRNA (cytidine(1402)-2'-O)-methyltransferase [Clostridia bacterium]|nr:16S rRNA (cytidine(1402)-2'-O)-methyltransferase [Clostridia bacterium]
MPKLYVVATPIGNLNDLTPRMREALENADLITAEDTRVTMKLLNQFGLKKPMTSCHRHNEEGKAPQLVERMVAEDMTVALTCDAGTPGISDPGHALVRACWEADVPVEPVCGPSAVVTALSVSGFDAREFAFYGFLPREKKALSDKLDAIRRAGVPVFVLYESPHRIVELVAAIAEKWPDCLLCVCSDLTKKFERLYRGTAPRVLAMLSENPSVEKGEYCLAADISMLPPPDAPAQRPEAAAFMLARMLDGQDLRDAAEAALAAGYARNAVYRAKLKIAELFEDEAP